MTAPAVGTIVFYTPGKDEPISTENAAGLPAMVVSTRTVNENDLITLVVFDSSGRVHSRNNVSLPVIAEGETDPPVMGPYYMDALRDITPPEPVPPELTALDPSHGQIGGADVEMVCIGKGFTPASVIMFAGQPEVIRYYGPESISTMITMSLGWGAGPVPVTVKNGELETAALEFTFDAAEPVVEDSPITYPEGEAAPAAAAKSKAKAEEEDEAPKGKSKR